MKISELAQKSSCRPHPLDVSPVARPHANPADRPGRQPGAGDGDDAGHVERVLADDVNDIWQRHRQRHLGGARTAEPRQRGAEQPPRDRAEHETADKCRHESEYGIHNARLHAIRQHRDEDAEQHDRGGVVEQAFAFEKPVQARRRAQLAKDRDDRRRIGRRDNRPEQQADGQRDAGKGQAEPDRRGRREYGEDRQRQDRPDIPSDLAQVYRQRGVEQQQRQKDGQKHRRADREFDERPGDFQHGSEARVVYEKRRNAADEHADAGEHHRKRHVQSCRERLNRADDDQKRRDDEGCARDRVHTRELSIPRRDGDEISGSSRSSARKTPPYPRKGTGERIGSESGRAKTANQ